MRSRHAVARFAIAATLATGLATTAWSTPARADTHGDAVKAFEEGRKLRETDPDKAAQAFERSIKLEPSIGAYYNLGQMNEQLDRPREAIDAFRKAEKLAIQKGDPRSKDAQEAWGELLDTRNYVVVNVSDEIKAAPGLTVVVDGVPVPEAQYNGEVFRPVTTHDVVVSARGRRDLRLHGLPNKQPVAIHLGSVASVAGEPSTSQPAPGPTPPESPSGGWGWQKWTGAGMTAVGVGGMAYALISYVGYRNRESSLADTRQAVAGQCTGPAADHPDMCPQDPDGSKLKAAKDAIGVYQDNEDSAKRSAPLWITAASVGLLLTVGGVYLFATAPSASESPPPAASARSGVHVQVIPRFGLHDTGVGVVGTF